MFYLNNKLQGVQKNVSLAAHTTFKIGGKAKYFFIAKSNEDLIKAIEAAKKVELPVFILGRGSNILINDKGFDGLVIKIQNTKHKIQTTKIVAEAGTNLGKLVGESVKAGLSGLEWAVGIPGTVSGAVRGNAGAFGSSMADLIKTIEIFDIADFKIKTLENKNCKFGYRDSIFKHNKNLIILSTELELKRGNREKSKNLIKGYLKQRKEKQVIEYPSAGCVFKNPKDFSAGYLIEQCGLKGRKIGKAMISKKHANFIVNLGGAKAEDVKKLINLCKGEVKKKFGIELKEEIEYLDKF